MPDLTDDELSAVLAVLMTFDARGTFLAGSTDRAIRKLRDEFNRRVKRTGGPR